MRKYEKEEDELIKCAAGDKHLHLKLNAVRRNEGQCVEILQKKREEKEKNVTVWGRIIYSRRKQRENKCLKNRLMVAKHLYNKINHSNSDFDHNKLTFDVKSFVFFTYLIQIFSQNSDSKIVTVL